MRNFQGAADAIAQEVFGVPTERSAIPSSVLDGVQLSVLALRAASFALVLGTDAQGGLLARGDRLEVVAEQLQVLLESTASRTNLLVTLGNHHSRARARYKELLETLERNQSGLGVVSSLALE